MLKVGSSLGSLRLGGEKGIVFLFLLHRVNACAANLRNLAGREDSCGLKPAEAG
jgi:hypothetical protein